MSKLEEKHTVREDSKGRKVEEHVVKRTGEYAAGGEKAPGLLDKVADLTKDAWEATKETASNVSHSLQETFAPREEGKTVHREVYREGPYGERIEKEEYHRRT
ncbi:LEA-like protein [Aphelenchoides avenae]|nr:LEA-like protein [Aphelenchus avenae]